MQEHVTFDDVNRCEDQNAFISKVYDLYAKWTEFERHSQARADDLMVAELANILIAADLVAPKPVASPAMLSYTIDTHQLNWISSDGMAG
jgi:hypothetical protein